MRQDMMSREAPRSETPSCCRSNPPNDCRQAGLQQQRQPRHQRPRVKFERVEGAPEQGGKNHGRLVGKQVSRRAVAVSRCRRFGQAISAQGLTARKDMPSEGEGAGKDS